MKVRTFTISGLVTDIRNLMEDSGNVSLWCNKTIKRWINKDIQFIDDIEARIFVKSFVAFLHKNKFQYSDDVLTQATEYTKEFINNPSWSFLRCKDEDLAEDNTATKTINDTKVKLNNNGKIKQGGKQILALELFNTHILNTDTPLPNKEFVELLMNELKLTKLCANTYFFNMRKQHGMVIARSTNNTTNE